ncbi:hypothetical protein RM572_00380 [Streptomyces sp. DSM 42041]|uniref:Uncharacterized protein n=1 Tax=Streptomyces hazeniae TaxID=3075538 RepID=A0ABU2NJT0_9ACTN|nr:hypothetical protein [Streptomyces sp. DSM 42041]MDT0377232.1 hypothetical protein [Streptomyces sp. DSM 42041]
MTSGRVPPYVAAECRTEGCPEKGTVRRVRLDQPHPGLVAVPHLVCASCHQPVPVPWPEKEGTSAVPKITRRGGASNAAASPPAKAPRSQARPAKKAEPAPAAAASDPADEAPDEGG